MSVTFADALSTNPFGRLGEQWSDLTMAVYSWPEVLVVSQLILVQVTHSA